MNQLTWYPGTILPYTSLWHTLLRATWLNNLHEGDLAKAAGYRARRQVASAEKSLRAEYQAIRRALGESGETFRFGTFAQWPRCLSPKFVTEGLRWCPSCLSSGYHTLLSSLRLLSRCPIHGDPLQECCPNCLENFNVKIRGLCVSSPLTCKCGRIRLLEPATCRQPSLSRVQTQCWHPVALWLQRVGSINIGQLPGGDPSADTQLALASWWSRDLGIDYPDCFEPPSYFWGNEDEPRRWRSYVVESGKLVNLEQISSNKEISIPAEVSVFKSMSLHLRRHGLRRPDKWIVKLMTSVDPITFTEIMAKNDKARMAFKEMLWTRAMNQASYLCRWPNRETAWGYMAPYKGVLKFGDHLQQLGWRGKRLPSTAEHWALLHVAACMANIAWERAGRLTEESILNHWADWSNDPEVFAGRFAWCVRRRGGRFLLAAYIKDGSDERFAASVPRKPQRGEECSQPEQTAHTTIRALGEGVCLLWNENEGWHTGKTASVNLGEKINRIRLFHVEPRADCWIYKSDERFITRLINGNIQVSANTSREAIEGLRQALLLYRRTFDTDYAKYTAVSQEKISSSSQTESKFASILDRGMYQYISEKKFWSLTPEGMHFHRELFLRKEMAYSATLDGPYWRLVTKKTKKAGHYQ